MKTYAEFVLQHFAAFMYLIVFYSAVIALCFVFGFWSTVRLNILSYFSPIDLIRVSAVPYMASIFFSIGGVIYLAAPDLIFKYKSCGKFLKFIFAFVSYYVIPGTMIICGFVLASNTARMMIFVAVLFTALISVLVYRMKCRNVNAAAGICLLVVAIPVFSYAIGKSEFRSKAECPLVLIVDNEDSLLPRGEYSYIDKVGDRIFVIGDDNATLYGIDVERVPIVKIKNCLKKS